MRASYKELVLILMFVGIGILIFSSLTYMSEKGQQDTTFTNVVDFERGSLKGFRVVVEGEPLSVRDVGLTFKAVKILRNSRFPRLFGQFTFRLPSRLIRWFASRNKPKEERSRGPYLQVQYLDDNLRMHTTDTGNWFIQTRLESRRRSPLTHMFIPRVFRYYVNV